MIASYTGNLDINAVTFCQMSNAVESSSYGYQNKTLKELSAGSLWQPQNFKSFWFFFLVSLFNFESKYNSFVCLFVFGRGIGAKSPSKCECLKELYITNERSSQRYIEPGILSGATWIWLNVLYIFPSKPNHGDSTILIWKKKHSEQVMMSAFNVKQQK